VNSRRDREGIPVALMEATSCGLLVISGDLPAFASSSRTVSRTTSMVAAPRLWTTG